MNLIRILIFTFLWCASVMNGFAQKSVTYQLSTHMLDISKGQPAPHVTVTLYKLDSITDNWKQITTGKTDENGRIANLLPLPKDNSGIYKLKFETTPYFRAQNLKIHLSIRRSGFPDRRQRALSHPHNDVGKRIFDLPGQLRAKDVPLSHSDIYNIINR